MNNAKDNKTQNVINEQKTAGLKKYSEELNRIVIESLQDALLLLIPTKPYEKITITELCDKAGVSRMAFYGNFKTKDDILESIIYGWHQDLMTRIGSPFQANLNESWYEALFNLVKENRRMLKLIFDVGFQSRYLEIVNAIALRHKNMSTHEKTLRLLWVGGIINLTVNWLITDLKESPRELSISANKLLKNFNKN